jgi:hypothetical protein
MKRQMCSEFNSIAGKCLKQTFAWILRICSGDQINTNGIADVYKIIHKYIPLCVSNKRIKAASSRLCRNRLKRSFMLLASEGTLSRWSRLYLKTLAPTNHWAAW